MTSSEARSPRVSVVIINWNAAQDTLISINSCKAQSFQDIEIVVVDNGSTDDSRRVLRATDGIRLIEAENNTGFAGGVNGGLAEIDRTPGRLVLLLNNDAAMEPFALEKMVTRIDEDPAIGIMGGMVRDSDTGKIQFPGGGHLNYLSGSSQPSSSALPDFISGAFMLFRSDVLVAIGGLCESYFMYWEDVDFSLRARQTGWKLGVALDAVAHHKGMGSTGADSPTYDYYFTRSAIQFFWHGAGRRKLIPIMSILAKKCIKRSIFGPRTNLRSLMHAARDGFTGTAATSLAEPTQAHRKP